MDLLDQAQGVLVLGLVSPIARGLIVRIVPARYAAVLAISLKNRKICRCMKFSAFDALPTTIDIFQDLYAVQLVISPSSFTACRLTLIEF